MRWRMSARSAASGATATERITDSQRRTIVATIAGRMVMAVTTSSHWMRTNTSDPHQRG